MKIKDFIGLVSFDPPASEATLNPLSSNFKGKLPDEYLELLRRGDGFEGELGQTYFSFWPASEVVQLNVDFKIQKYLGDQYFGFATNGGGKIFCFGLGEVAGVFLSSLGDLDLNELQFVCSNLGELFDFALTSADLSEY